MDISTFSLRATTCLNRMSAHKRRRRVPTATSPHTSDSSCCSPDPRGTSSSAPGPSRKWPEQKLIPSGRRWPSLWPGKGPQSAACAVDLLCSPQTSEVYWSAPSSPPSSLLSDDEDEIASDMNLSEETSSKSTSQVLATSSRFPFRFSTAQELHAPGSTEAQEERNLRASGVWHHDEAYRRSVESFTCCGLGIADAQLTWPSFQASQAENDALSQESCSWFHQNEDASNPVESLQARIFLAQETFPALIDTDGSARGAHLQLTIEVSADAKVRDIREQVALALFRHGIYVHLEDLIITRRWEEEALSISPSLRSNLYLLSKQPHSERPRSTETRHIHAVESLVNSQSVRHRYPIETTHDASSPPFDHSIQYLARTDDGALPQTPQTPQTQVRRGSWTRRWRELDDDEECIRHVLFRGSETDGDVCLIVALRRSIYTLF